MTIATIPGGNGKYTAANSIKVLEGLEAVRKRPDMFIGANDKQGLHHLIWEIVDNAVDEYLNGFADAITVTLHRDGDAVTVTDNGRGIPVDIHPEYRKPGLELILTTLHSGAKFGDGDDYIHSGGLHGVGSSVVNALSSSLIATVRRDGFEWQQEYARGKPLAPLRQVGPARGHGTTIYFKPDGDIFRDTRFDADLIRQRLEDMSYIHSGLKLVFRNEVRGETLELKQAGGLASFVARLVAEGQKEAIHEPIFSLARGNGEKMEVALQWTASTDETIRSYVNGIRTSGGGTHENGLKRAVTTAVRNFMDTHKERVKSRDLNITAEDVREGLVAVLSVFVRDPRFQGQTKERLNNQEMTSAVDTFVRPALESWLNANMTVADQIVGRILMAARAREASRKAVDEVKRKSPTNRRLTLPGKLADCKTTRPDEAELFLVEGDSAGGSAKQGRDNYNQAVLPLRGKVLNTESRDLSRVLLNQELKDLISVLGTGVGDKFNLAGLRYGKIILLMDADADGNHITTLLLAFFFRHLPELIHKGKVFIAQPPLYRIDVGKEKYWARDDRHKEQILKSLKTGARPQVSRFKGLGEMDARELAETTLDPKKRTLLKVEIGSLIDADRVLVELLGKDAACRYRFIMDQAVQTSAEELDL